MSDSTNDKDFLNESRLNSKTRRERPKRKIVPSNVKVSKSPQLTTLVNDALSIIGAELSFYRKKTAKGITLDLKESRAVTAYMDSLVKMSKEAREAQESQSLEHLSDEELIKLLQAEADDQTKKDE